MVSLLDRFRVFIGFPGNCCRKKCTSLPGLPPSPFDVYFCVRLHAYSVLWKVSLQSILKRLKNVNGSGSWPRDFWALGHGRLRGPQKPARRPASSLRSQAGPAGQPGWCSPAPPLALLPSAHPRDPQTKVQPAPSFSRRGRSFASQAGFSLSCVSPASVSASQSASRHCHLSRRCDLQYP